MSFRERRTDNFEEFCTNISFHVLRKRRVEPGDTLRSDPLGLCLGVGFLLLVHQLVVVPSLVQGLLIQGGDGVEYFLV